jgi:hypothetical protein
LSTPAIRSDHESKQLGRRVTELACQQTRGAELDLTASELLAWD